MLADLISEILDKKLFFHILDRDASGREFLDSLRLVKEGTKRTTHIRPAVAHTTGRDE